MYTYYIRDDVNGLYLIGRMKMGAPVPTCVWGNRRADMLTFDNSYEARKVAVEIGDSSVSVYRINQRLQTEIRLKTGQKQGDDERPTIGRAEGEHTGCAARNPWPDAGADRGRNK